MLMNVLFFNQTIQKLYCFGFLFMLGQNFICKSMLWKLEHGAGRCRLSTRYPRRMSGVVFVSTSWNEGIMFLMRLTYVEASSIPPY